MKYKPYMHVERWGHDEVEGIEHGTTWVFPKVDGTNASVWLDNGNVCAGSRTRQLSKENDNAGFYAYVDSDPRIYNYLEAHPNHRLHGEWLVPHTLKTYRQDAWRRFWIFDVEVGDEFLNYDQYSVELQKHGLDFVVPMFKLENANYDYLLGALERNTFLIDDGKGLGEGVVVKNYDFKNKFGRTIWAKIVRQEFKEKNAVEFGVPTIGLTDAVEKAIINEFLTLAMIDKVQAKIVNEMGGWKTQYIPRLLETCFYDLVREEMWEIIKKHKNPTINFKSLKAYAIQKIKAERKDLF